MKTKTTKPAAKTATKKRNYIPMSETTYNTILKAVGKGKNRKDGRITKTTDDVMTVTGVSRRTVTNGLNNLIVNNVIRKEGATKKATYYFI